MCDNLDDLYTKRSISVFCTVRINLTNASTAYVDNAQEIGEKLSSQMESKNMPEGIFIGNVVWRGQSFIAGIRYKSGTNYYITGFSTTGSVPYSFYRNSGDMKYYIIARN